MHCLNHPQRQADFVCSNCRHCFCKNCVHLRGNAASRIEICPSCGHHLERYVPENTQKPSWLSRIFSVFETKHRDPVLDTASLMEQANRNVRRNRFDEAMVNLDLLLEIEPDNIEALELRYRLLEERKDSDASEDAGASLVSTLAKIGDTTRSLAAYRKICAAHPKFNPGPEALFRLAEMFYGKDHLDEAANALRKLSVMHPDHELAPKALFRCAFILDTDLGKSETARKIYRYLIEKHPASTFATKAGEILNGPQKES